MRVDLNEFKDKLFDILNETEHLPIIDIVVEDKRNRMKIYLSDGALFKIQCEQEKEKL